MRSGQTKIQINGKKKKLGAHQITREKEKKKKKPKHNLG
jgi:hypothetical protein